MGRRPRSSRIVPPAGPPRVLAIAQLTNSIGDGAYYVCSVLYFTRIVGLSATQVGFGLTLGWAFGAVAGVPVGQLADRRGSRGTAIVLSVATALAVGSFLFVRSFGLFVVVACLYACCQSGLPAARQALLAGLVEKARRTEVRAYLQSAVNAGLSIGAAIGGLTLRFDTRPAYLAVFAMDAAGFLVSGLVLLRVAPVRPVTTDDGGRSLAVLRDRPYALVSFLNMMMLLYMPMLSVAIPLWIAQRTAAPRWMVAAVMVFNTVGVGLFQVRMARRVSGLGSAARSVRRGGLAFLAACAVFALSGVVSGAWAAAFVLLVAVALEVIGEMMLAAGAWELAFDLAPPDKQGQYQGFFGSGTAVARMLGPLLLTALIVSWGTPGWLLLGALFLTAGAAMVPAVRYAERSRAVRATAVPDPPHPAVAG
jgi:MFS family permease